jgi:hypothetical protein
VPTLHETVHSKTTDMLDLNDEAWNVRQATQQKMEEQRASFKQCQVYMFRSGVYHSVCFTGSKLTSDAPLMRIRGTSNAPRMRI